MSFKVITYKLVVVCYTAEVNTLCTNGKTEEQSVLYISADVEVKFTDVSLVVIHAKVLCTIRHVVNTLFVIVVVHQVIHVVTLPSVRPHGKHSLLADTGVCQFSHSIQNLVEVSALLEVETKVQE